MKRMFLSMLLLPLVAILGFARPAYAGEECFLGEISLFGGNFNPRNWAQLDGQILSINQNQALFSILGTTYGGDGRTTFALPDLRGRVAIGPRQGPGLTNRTLGQKGGTENQPLSVGDMPVHTHTMHASTNMPAGIMQGTNPTNRVFGQPVSAEIYSAVDSAEVAMSSAAIGNAGTGQGHNNQQPSRALNYIICLSGLFPPRN